MIYISSESMDGAFHFASEEYVIEGMKPGSPVFMLWRTDRTVMLGANQVAEAEVDLPYAAARGIAVVRRSSGGGAIYTDPGALLYTIILPFTERTDTKAVIEEYLAGPVIDALGSMGVAASLEGRNDILVGGKKISGIAQYIRDGYLCSHGSLLFDADLAELARVLTVDDEKIVSKALRSIRSRVTNIAPHLPEYGGAAVGAATDAQPHIQAFIGRLRASWNGAFGLSPYEFTDGEMDEIAMIRAEKYASDRWTFGRAPRYSYRHSTRFPGGSVEVFADIKGGVIEQVKIVGDFLALRPVEELECRFVGVPFRAEALSRAISEYDVIRTLGSITKDELLSVFT
ncbi:MAG: lipoate--protein ligase [Clostridiales Family XIII bacterium]|jgi:lipoate-protein ligase A|nr:lipoate--protein ligase [Clostridiales Family XIII bacterium]